MVKTLRESKAKLSELVERASKGEDVLITVRGKAKARLTQVVPKPAVSTKTWADELRAHLSRMPPPSKKGPTTDEILAELREDRF